MLSCRFACSKYIAHPKISSLLHKYEFSNSCNDPEFSIDYPQFDLINHFELWISSNTINKIKPSGFFKTRKYFLKLSKLIFLF